MKELLQPMFSNYCFWISTEFRFLFAHFPSSAGLGHEFHLFLWKSVYILSMFRFKIQYVSTDGAQGNRDVVFFNFTTQFFIMEIQ